MSAKWAGVFDLDGNRRTVNANDLVLVKPAVEEGCTVLVSTSKEQTTIRAPYENVKAMLERLQ
jgi:hypothetical protein